MARRSEPDFAPRAPRGAPHAPCEAGLAALRRQHLEARRTAVLSAPARRLGPRSVHSARRARPRVASLRPSSTIRERGAERERIGRREQTQHIERVERLIAAVARWAVERPTQRLDRTAAWPEEAVAARGRPA